jgi:hypothetical protein
MIKYARAAIVLAFALLGSSASATVLHCKVKVGASQDNWISEELYFDFDAAANKATVLDGIVHYYFKKPIAAKLTHKEGVKEAFSWKIQSTSTTGQQVNMLYRAAYFYADDSVTLSATAPGYSNAYNTRGTCKKLKN